MDPEVRFRRHIRIKRKTGCWIWTGATWSQGYGRFWDGDKTVYAHIWAYKHWVGPIPDGKQLDHFECDTPACANPYHVRPTTGQNNIRRARGLPLIPED